MLIKNVVEKRGGELRAVSVVITDVSKYSPLRTMREPKNPGSIFMSSQYLLPGVLTDMGLEMWIPGRVGKGGWKTEPIVLCQSR